MPWIAKLSRSIGTEYYFNTDTNETTWDLPYELGGQVIEPIGVAGAAGAAVSMPIPGMQQGNIPLNQQYQYAQFQQQQQRFQQLPQPAEVLITSQKIKEQLLNTLEVVKQQEETVASITPILEKEIKNMEVDINAWSDDMRVNLSSQSQRIEELIFQKNSLLGEIEKLIKSISNELPDGYGGVGKGGGVGGGSGLGGGDIRCLEEGRFIGGGGGGGGGIVGLRERKGLVSTKEGIKFLMSNLHNGQRVLCLKCLLKFDSLK